MLPRLKVDQMGDTLDLLIIGSSYGEGQRRGGDVSHFLLGLRAPDFERQRHGAATDHPLYYPFCKVRCAPTPRSPLLSPRAERPPRGYSGYIGYSRAVTAVTAVTVVTAVTAERPPRDAGPTRAFYWAHPQVGTGYTKARLVQLREQLKPAQKKWHKHEPPPHLCGWVPNKTDDVPDFWYEPAKSVVMEVHAYEITSTMAFLPCGFTLRFPRCKKIRDDKSYSDCETHDEIARRVKENRARCVAPPLPGSAPFALLRPRPRLPLRGLEFARAEPD